MAWSSYSTIERSGWAVQREAKKSANEKSCAGKRRKTSSGGIS
jgi:hypothetical protein